METKFFTIQQTAEITGLTAHTLRYYEKIGLLNGVHRDSNGYREYSESDISWIDFLLRLRITGMNIRDMKRFSHLRSQGDSTIQARRELLEAHQRTVLAKMKELKKNLMSIEEKIETYKWMEETHQ
ncbi:MerR family transcriptional regulator [Paenibacillus ferrarius]|uniref:MerR family transcriptional regulator n=1 Tax=Paenibacillus ferrarius TaxID=1469647 RepID=UPI003D2E7F6B